MSRATRSQAARGEEARPQLRVSLGFKKRPPEAQGEDLAVAAPAPKRPRPPPAQPLYDPNDMSPEGQYQTRFHTMRQKQLEQLRAVRMQQAQVQQGAMTSEGSFDLLMQSVQAYTQGSVARTGPRSKGSHRHSGTDEQMQDDVGASGLTQTPPYLKGELRHYQIEGVNWLINLFDSGLNGILADEMGLGKTFQTIALLGYLKKSRGIPGPHLVVCPLSICMNWCKEVKKWCPDLTVLKFHGSKEERARMRQEDMIPGKYDVIVTTYETANAEKGVLQKFRFKYIIVDEAHRLKNEDSMLSHTMRRFQGNHRMLVTGTPLQNNLHELWALLNFLLPDLFNDGEEFDNWYDAREGTTNTNVIQQMHKLLKPFMLRRLKAEVNTSIPPKKEIYVGCGMSKMQREWYTNVLAKDAAVVNQGTGSKTKLLNVVMQLRKTCNHPYLFDGAEEGPPFITDEEIVNNSGKMRVLDKLLSRLKAEGHRVLLFCQMTRMLDIMEDYLIWKGYTYYRLDGSTSPFERDERMEGFNAPDSPVFLFMLSTRAGGLGINLATADTVILYDSDWNPQMDLQAQDRAHRIGQKKPVTVFRFIADGTVEERVYQRALKKLYLDAAVIQQGRLQAANTAASKDELLSMIRFGAEQMFKSRVDEVTDEDIDILLQRGEAKTSSLTSKMQKGCQMSLANFSMGIEDANMYEFEGVNYTINPSRQIYLKNINETVAEQEIREAFLQFGDPKRIVISPTRDNALVEFGSLAAAQQAYNHVKNTKTVAKCTDVEVFYGNKANLNIVGVENIQDAFTVKSKRACVIDYQESQLAAQQVAPPEVKGPKLPKKPSYNAWQFFDTQRLEEIWELECKYTIQQHERKMEEKRLMKEKKQYEELMARRRKAEAANNVVKVDEEAGADARAASPKSEPPPVSPTSAKREASPASPTSATVKAEAAEANRPGAAAPAESSMEVDGAAAAEDKATGDPGGDADMSDGDEDADLLPREFSVDAALTSSERLEKEQLLEAGFADWKHGDYQRFVKAVVSHGRANLDGICAAMSDKPAEEVQRYSEAFWEMGPSALGEGEWTKVLKRIEKAQAERDSYVDRIRLLKWKAESCEDVSQISFGMNRPTGTSAWDEEEDRQLVVVANEVGYGQWDQIRDRLEQVPSLVFDWHIKLRTAGEIKTRTEHLIRQIDRETNPEAAAKKNQKGQGLQTRGGRKKQEAEEEAPAAEEASPIRTSPVSASASEGFGAARSRATKKRNF